MGKPNLYKREVPYDIELADDFNLSSTPEMEKWFLLFPTKKHWRENSDISGIEKGLLWLTTNYEVEGIKSIAIPALGCGLGNLSWSDVGPLMCHYLTRMKIPVSIYLPAEKKIPDAQLSESFLLSM
jgi:hypothetical protein